MPDHLVAPIDRAGAVGVALGAEGIAALDDRVGAAPALAGGDVCMVRVVLPVLDDWESLRLVLEDLDRVLDANQVRASVLIVDDGSPTPPPEGSFERPFRAIQEAQVLELRRNLGHQRAIAIGLSYVEACCPPLPVVIMDSDGEDAPSDVLRLLQAYNIEEGRKIVFAERSQRSESLGFRLGYHAYRFLYRVLTGKPIRFGNFSIVPPRRLESLVVVSELWNHYTAAVVKSRQPFVTVPTKRAKRLRGKSRMKPVHLITHGLSAISVDSDVVGARLLLVSLFLILLTGIGLVATVFIRLFTALAIPGWATTAAGVFAIMLFQAVLLATVFSFVTLSGRQGSSFLPQRDYVYYIRRVYSIPVQS